MTYMYTLSCRELARAPALHTHMHMAHKTSETLGGIISKFSCVRNNAMSTSSFAEQFPHILADLALLAPLGGAGLTRLRARVERVDGKLCECTACQTFGACQTIGIAAGRGDSGSSFDRTCKGCSDGDKAQRELDRREQRWH